MLKIIIDIDIDIDRIGLNKVLITVPLFLKSFN